MNQNLGSVILQNMMETEKLFRQNKRKGSSGLVFSAQRIGEQMNVPQDQVIQSLDGLANEKKVHKVSRGHYSLGDNPWGGQRRQKIFRCQHCGQMNTVDITGD